MDKYSNADILMAVVDHWSKPLVAQLPPQLSMLAPVLMPVLKNFLAMIPDAAIPQSAKAIVDSAVNQGSVRIGNVRLTSDDLVTLQRLLELNMPSEPVEKSGYCVITD